MTIIGIQNENVAESLVREVIKGKNFETTMNQLYIVFDDIENAGHREEDVFLVAPRFRHISFNDRKKVVHQLKNRLIEEIKKEVRTYEETFRILYVLESLGADKVTSKTNPKLKFIKSFNFLTANENSIKDKLDTLKLLD